MAAKKAKGPESRRRRPPPAATKSWSVYVLRCAGGTLYTGITNDLEERLKAHRAGRGAKYTRGRLPLELMYVQRVASRGVAARREREIKSLGRCGKLALIGVEAGTRNSRPEHPPVR
jgi:putative endonuclease